MLLKKITTGFVVQTYDMDKGAWIDQEFVAGDQCDYEVNGEAVDGDHPFFSKDDGTEPYLPFEMVQPGIVEELGLAKKPEPLS